LRNLQDGSTFERTFHSGEKVDEISVSSQEMQYLYKQDEHYVFMNTETFEQTFLDEALIGNKKGFLKDGTLVNVLLMGEKALDITLPNFVELKVVESSISNKTDTVTNQAKMVVMETGVSIGVPTFIKEGDILKIDTRSGSYVERITQKK
jgi:elongation factor P